ncbi:MAG: putative toxin-antitoxin system toxin component, PIN family [Spirochaetales bacterium]
MIATLDTNVLVSGTVFGGVPGSIINAAVDRRFILALSPAVLHEYEGVLYRSKFGLLPEAVELLVRDMESHAHIVHPTKKHQIVADDPDDDVVVDCAVEAKADVIVSGDSHLIGLRQVEGIPVITPAEFLEMLK